MLVMSAVAMLFVLAATGFVVDGGQLYSTKSHLQKTANAAALSGAQEIPNSQAAVEGVVQEVMAAHNEAGSLQSVNVTSTEVHVTVGRPAPVFFASLFGQETIPVEVEAKAAIEPIARATKAVPLGIDESIPLVYGQDYDLKVDSGDGEGGHFGILALGGPGAQSYQSSLTYGYQGELAIGDIIQTQTGNIAGPTRAGINHRIANCPYPAEGLAERDCSRVMLVIVYVPHEKSNKQLKSIRITGFAYFYVHDPMGKNDDSIRGTFIRRAGPGEAGEAPAPDKGAYTVRLIK